LSSFSDHALSVFSLALALATDHGWALACSEGSKFIEAEVRVSILIEACKIDLYHVTSAALAHSASQPRSVAFGLAKLIVAVMFCVAKLGHDKIFRIFQIFTIDCGDSVPPLPGIHESVPVYFTKFEFDTFLFFRSPEA
jgi:hypothetical protein